MCGAGHSGHWPPKASSSWRLSCLLSPSPLHPVLTQGRFLNSTGSALAPVGTNITSGIVHTSTIFRLRSYHSLSWDMLPSEQDEHNDTRGAPSCVEPPVPQGLTEASGSGRPPRSFRLKGVDCLGEEPLTCGPCTTGLMPVPGIMRGRGPDDS